MKREMVIKRRIPSEYVRLYGDFSALDHKRLPLFFPDWINDEFSGILRMNMKKIVLALILFCLSAVPASAQTNMCNQRCEVDSDCGNNYRCYVGVCRLDACPAISACNCAGTTPTIVPVASVRPTATPTPLPTLKPSATPSATASSPAILKRTPQTGSQAFIVAGIAVAMYLVGTALQSFNQKALAAKKA